MKIIILIITIIFSISSIAKETAVEIQKDFFHGATDVPALLKSYSTMPDSKLAISANNYGRVVDVFYWWIRRALKTQFIPSKEFVIKNIKLFPAKTNKHKEDLVFLAYEAEKKSFMIVQTGGIRSRMMIFINIPSKEEKNSSEQKSITAEEFLKTYFNKKFQSYIPGFTAKQNAESCIATGKTIRPKLNLKYALCYIKGNDVCLFIRKMYFLDSINASEPLPNHWFSWLENKKE